MDKTKVPYFHLAMDLDDVERVPVLKLPPGFAVSHYEPGDEAAWARIETAAGEFSDQGKALAHFEREFGGRELEMSERCLFLRAPGGDAIGTSTAWYGERGGRVIGRLHWVAIVPAFQGRGLAKPLVSASMALMRGRHRSAYLTTQTTSWIAVKVYLDFGFRPAFDQPDSERAWAVVAELLGHPALDGLRR